MFAVEDIKDVLGPWAPMVTHAAGVSANTCWTSQDLFRVIPEMRSAREYLSHLLLWSSLLMTRMAVFGLRH